MRPIKGLFNSEDYPDLLVGLGESDDAAVIRAKGDADARLLQAAAEAKALELIAGALKGRPEMLQNQYITRLAPGIQVMLVPNNAPYLLPLPTLQSPQTSGTIIPAPAPGPTSTTP